MIKSFGKYWKILEKYKKTIKKFYFKKTNSLFNTPF